MKVLFITDTVDCWKHGIWYHRQETPTKALMLRGHSIKQVAIGDSFPEHLLDFPDTVVFGRTYPTKYDPVKWMREYKKRGKRVLYDMDDDFWNVSKNNPSVLTSSALKDQYEGQIREADAVITPSKELAKFFKKKFKKQVFLCPNAINPDEYKPRDNNKNDLIIGYMGAASHWDDLKIIAPVITELAKKHNFLFTIYGLTAEPLEAAMYSYAKILSGNYLPEKKEYFQSAIDFYKQLENLKMWHIPFMPPELHPTVLGRCDFDIGLAPLENTEFNTRKSCIKFYEYAGVGTVTLASDIEPYKSEVNYRAKNTFKDWYNKLEKLIVDEQFRIKTLNKQQEYVFKHRTIDKIGLDWELACQRPSKLKVLNQS